MSTTMTAQPSAEDAATDPSAVIDTLRARIDDLDQNIIALVRERAAVSAQVQAARVQAGGTRLELGRERAILAHFREGLGQRGPSLGEVILRICRGER